MKIIELKGWIHLQRTLILHPTDSIKLDRAFLIKETTQKHTKRFVPEATII